MEDSADVHVLILERSRAMLERFRKEYLAGMHESVSGYEYPQHAERPRFDSLDLEALLDELFADPAARYSIYWAADDQRARIVGGMVVFTEDGCLIFGLFTHQGMEDEVLAELMKAFGTTNGIVCYHVPPPKTAVAFLRIASE